MKAYSRIAITGHKGILGSLFADMIDGELSLIDLPEIDITDRELTNRVIRDFKPELIIHCAAYTDVVNAETEKEKAHQVNVLATQWIAEIAADINAVMAYFSTDFVFYHNSCNQPIKESEEPQPEGVYARSKFAGEKAVSERLDRYFTIRTSWLYGFNGKNFVDTIIKLAGEKKQIKVINDQIGTPTYAADLAKETLRVIDYGKFGIYHISNNGSCSWYDFASEIIRQMKLECEVIPITTEEYNSPAPRPRYSVLDHGALRDTIGDNMPHWKKSLREYLKLKTAMEQNK